VYDRCRVARQNWAELSTKPFRLGDATPKKGFMQGTDIYDVLKKIKVPRLHHANSVTTSCTFLDQGGLLSRQFVEQHKLNQTAQSSDADDKKFGIWDRIFVDQVDIHARARKKKAPNEYGPVLFLLELDALLQLPAGTDVLVTKDNPIYWEGKPDADRWFQSTEELGKGMTLGTFGQMIMIRTPSGKLDFPNGYARIILDDPHRKLSSGEDAYAHAAERLRAAAEVGKINAAIERRECQADCICPKTYAAWKTQDIDLYFG
jgi:hypothetical protein